MGEGLLLLLLLLALLLLEELDEALSELLVPVSEALLEAGFVPQPARIKLLAKAITNKTFFMFFYLPFLRRPSK
jgi:hypothetical protein